MAEAYSPAHADDYFDLDRALQPEDLQVRQTIRQFVDSRVRPYAGQWWQEGKFPRDLVAPLAQLGVFGPTLPEEFGGAGLSPMSYGLMMQELERGDSGLRSFASVQSGLAMHAIYQFGSPEQKQQYLPLMAQGHLIGCFGLTEPDAGSDPGAMRTVARKDGTHYILTGTKRWITNGSLAHVAIIWAKDDAGVIRGFVVPANSPGFRAVAITTKASMKMSVTSDLYLDDVMLPLEARLPLAAGLKSPLNCLTQARYGIVWGTIGAAMDCIDEAMAYTQTRIVFGRPLAQTQLVQERLVGMLSGLVDMQLRARQLAYLQEQGRLRYPQVSLAKRNNARAALEIARMGRELLGGNGISVDYHAIRHMTNLETVDTYEGAFEVQTLVVGRDLTGQDAF